MTISEQEAIDISWHLIAAHYKSLYGMALKAANYDPDIADEYMSDCIYVRMPNIVTRWLNGPRLSPVEYYMRSMIYWYLRKHRGRARRHDKRFNEPSLVEPCKSETNLSVEVSNLLEDLKPTDRQMVHLVYYEGYTLQECADKMGVSIGKVSGRLKRVFRILRQNHPEWTLDDDQPFTQRS